MTELSEIKDKAVDLNVDTSSVMSIHDLDFYYGGVQALSQVNMGFTSGRMTCVMGRNGVGKTTLMRNIMGLESSSGGQINYNDQSIMKWSAHKRARAGIALVPQGRMIFPKLTVLENLKIGLQAKPGGGRMNEDEIFETFPILKEFLKRRGGDLSGGQQQQLAIARAMVGEPKVMLLDEPTEGIQPNIIQKIGEVLRDLIKRKNMTIVLVEQYVDFVKEFGDDFYIMNRGSVVAEGKTSELTKEMEREHLSV